MSSGVGASLPTTMSNECRTGGSALSFSVSFRHQDTIAIFDSDPKRFVLGWTRSMQLVTSWGTPFVPEI
jgi:hypothetical protein